MNPATGAVLWSADPGGCASGIAISGGLAYVDTDHLTAYNAVTGAQVFSSPMLIGFAQVAIRRNPAAKHADESQIKTSPTQSVERARPKHTSNAPTSTNPGTAWMK